jgi:nondiscriminating aspartyl-tRNA synthetase
MGHHGRSSPPAACAARLSHAEPHDTPRHPSEYVSLDAELGFIVDHGEVMMLAVKRRAPDAAAHLRTHPDPARPQFSNSFDLLFRGLELITGGQRLHR